MKTYIINLERSVDRKNNMEEQCRKLPFLDVEYINAVDGRSMNAEERAVAFDEKKFEKRYFSKVLPGEIGCTLSHQKCYRKIVDESLPYALILEDDISLFADIKVPLDVIERKMQIDTPQIVLLSGWYYYTYTTPLIEQYKLAKVYDGVLAHSYIINFAAAKLLIEPYPYILADDWYYFRRKGIKLQAVLPHLIGQQWRNGDLLSTISVESVRRRRFKWKLFNLKRLFIRRFLNSIGYFEEA